MPECPICYYDGCIMDGPSNSDIKTECIHFLCTDCWKEIKNNDNKCPLCRRDVEYWLETYYYTSEDDN